MKNAPEMWQALKNFLKESFTEAHHPFNPAPDVMKKLEEKGYRFEFGVQALTKGYLCKNFTVVTPGGKRLGTSLPIDRLATPLYATDYAQAVRECRQQKPSSAP